MRGRTHRDQVVCKIQIVQGEKSGNSRKALCEVNAGDVTHIQVHGKLFVVRAHAFPCDGARDDVAGREFKQRMIALHEALAARVAQICTLAAQRFREEKARHPGQAERRGVELVELHVGDLGAGTVSHGDSVSGGHGGVGRVAIDLACSSAGQQHGARANGVQIVLTVEQPRAGHSVVFNDQIRGSGPFKQRNVLVLAGVRQERPADFGAGGVAVGVQDAVAAVRTFAGEHESALFAIEACTPAQQLFHTQWAFFDENLRRVAIDEAISCGDGVCEVQRDIFVAAESDSDSALSVVGIRLAEGFFCDDQYAASFRESDSGAQAGDSGAHDQKVGFCSYGHNV